RFIRPACYRFTNDEIIRMLTSRGLKVYTRPDGRIFPVDAPARDVLAILGSYLRDAGVSVRLKAPATSLLVEEPYVRGVWSNGENLKADAVILSVGGSSYPNSGTTGDGWPWTRGLGHKIVPIGPALAPIDLVNEGEHPAGVALRDCILKARSGGREIARWRGDLLFTHHGVSGPCALGISREVAEAGGGSLEADVAPDECFEELGRKLLNFCRENPKKQVSGVIADLVPESIVETVFNRAGVGRETMCSNLDRKARNRIVETLKALPLGDVKRVPLDRGEVVAGGVALDEVDPHTMRSLKAEGLYLCGEMLDIAGPVGGYNLQAAFATGFVAGESAACS
nr:aminoacetone oxidase family FAD-binding enzyme [Armatimonadota bacterium]